jgi:hypothetical protein
MKALTMFAQSN